MEATRIVQFPLNEPSPDVRVEGDAIVVSRLLVRDAALAAFVADRPNQERPGLVERALKIGLLALLDSGVTVNVDAVRREFETMLRQTEAANEKAAAMLEQTLRTNFADGDGRLPRTLEKFLGDRGALRSFVSELFDESKRDSAIGRIGRLLGTYFDGDASKLAQLLDPTRMNSPLHQFRMEIADGFEKLNARLTAIEAAAAARAVERSRSAAKGGDFEDLLEDLLGAIARGAGDTVDRTCDEIGAVMRSKKGDFVITLDPGMTRGVDRRIVVEAKDRAMSGREMRDELTEAKANRSATTGLVVFTPAHAPAGIAPFDVRGTDVYCVIDPAAPDLATLEAAVRLARLYALATMRDSSVEFDGEAVVAALTGIRHQLEAIKGLKSTLTSIGKSAGDVSSGLDRLRDGIIERVLDAETELRRDASALASS
ncbi:MAG TPA: hypothetical protein VGJ46_03395 [Candidatus Limnocylindrales bacterium]